MFVATVTEQMIPESAVGPETDIIITSQMTDHAVVVILSAIVRVMIILSFKMGDLCFLGVCGAGVLVAIVGADGGQRRPIRGPVPGTGVQAK